MKIAPVLFLACLALPLSAVASSSSKAFEPPVLVKRVLPPEPAPSSGTLMESTRVEMVVDSAGRPFSLKAASGLPDATVTALSKWRFKPGIKNNRRVAYTVTFLVPVPWIVTPAKERALAQTWSRNGSLAEVFELAKTWDIGKIEKAGRRRRNKSDRADIMHGTPLLHALLTGSSQDLHKARVDHLLWMVKHTPEAGILSTPAALVGASGEPLGDSELRQQIEEAWLKQVSAKPENFDVLDRALNFLEFADPTNAVALTANAKGWSKAALWLGNEYGLYGVGVTGLNPVSGMPNVHEHGLPVTPFAVETRLALLKGQDAKFVLAGLAAVIGTKQVLAKSGRVPAGLDEFCEKLFDHARQLYPRTTLSCDLTTPLFYQDFFQTTNGLGMTPPKLRKKVEPRYPVEGRLRKLEGTVKLSAIIDRQGRAEDIELLSGPLVFYRAAVDTVKQWEFKPATNNGQPIEIKAKMIINFRLTSW